MIQHLFIFFLTHLKYCKIVLRLRKIQKKKNKIENEIQRKKKQQ